MLQKSIQLLQIYFKKWWKSQQSDNNKAYIQPAVCLKRKMSSLVTYLHSQNTFFGIDFQARCVNIQMYVCFLAYML